MALAVVPARLVVVGLGYRHAERLGVERRLRDQAVGERQAQEARYARRQAQQKQVPVEAGWLAERELGSLSDE